MKELVIGFLIALCLGAIWNGMRTNTQPLGVDQGAMQPGLVGQELIAEVDQSMFQGYVLDSKDPVLVEFYTDTCAICKTMAPVLGKLALQGQSAVRFCKINAETNQTLAERYNVQGVPTFVLFKDGHMQDLTAGGMNEDEMRAWLANYDVNIPRAMPSPGSPEG